MALPASSDTARTNAARGASAKILFLFLSPADPYLTHRTSIKVYADAYAARGIGAIFLDLAAPDFGGKFAAAIVRSDVIAVHCEQGWGLDQTAEIDGKAADVFVASGKPALAHIRDYPFYPWLRAKVLTPREKRLLFFTEQSAAAFAAPFQAASGKAEFAPHIYLYDGARPTTVKPCADREIGLLYVGSYAEPMAFREQFAAAQPGRAALLDAVIDRCLFDHHTPFWQAADEVARAKGEAADHGDGGYLDLLVAANQFIRNERRRVLLTRLAKHPMHLVWSGPRPKLDLHPDTVVAPANTLPETLALCDNAKAMVMCLNNFPSSLSERLLSAMHRGAAVLCNSNGLIDATFDDGKDILTLDKRGENLDGQLARLTDQKFAEALTAAARIKVMEQFSPDVRIAHFLNGLGRAAAQAAP